MLEKIDHLNMTVANLEESIHWYGKVFGFEKKEAGVIRGHPWAIIAVNDFMLCMYENPRLQNPGDEPIEGPTKGVHRLNHFGIRIRDRQAWEDALKTHQIKINYGQRIAYPRSTSWYIMDPSGHEIEVSYTEKGLWP